MKTRFILSLFILFLSLTTFISAKTENLATLENIDKLFTLLSQFVKEKPITVRGDLLKSLLEMAGQNFYFSHLLNDRQNVTVSKICNGFSFEIKHPGFSYAEYDFKMKEETERWNPYAVYFENRSGFTVEWNKKDEKLVISSVKGIHILLKRPAIRFIAGSGTIDIEIKNAELNLPTHEVEYEVMVGGIISIRGKSSLESDLSEVDIFDSLLLNIIKTSIIYYL